jgi:hypothetical protein
MSWVPPGYDAKQAEKEARTENKAIPLTEKERVNQAAELEEVRQLLKSRMYGMRQSTADGEVWERQDRWRVTLLTDPNGVIRAEMRYPDGGLYTEVRQITKADVESVLQPAA